MLSNKGVKHDKMTLDTGDRMKTETETLDYQDGTVTSVRKTKCFAFKVSRSLNFVFEFKTRS